MAMPAQGSPSGPEMLGLMSLSAAESGSSRLRQPLGLCNLRGQGGGRASGLGTHDVAWNITKPPFSFSGLMSITRSQGACPSASSSGKMTVCGGGGSGHILEQMGPTPVSRSEGSSPIQVLIMCVRIVGR